MDEKYMLEVLPEYQKRISDFLEEIFEDRKGHEMLLLVGEIEKSLGEYMNKNLNYWDML